MRNAIFRWRSRWHSSDGPGKHSECASLKPITRGEFWDALIIGYRLGNNNRGSGLRRSLQHGLQSHGGNMIHQKRIRNLSLHLHGTPQGATVVCAIRVSDRFVERLTKIGFTSALANGETVLPSVLGPISRFNAEGRWSRQTDQPKETAYRTIEWHWAEFHGDQRVEQSDFRDIPYQRYPRTFIEPPAIELAVVEDGHGGQFVCAPGLVYCQENEVRLLHTVNLILELFGECELLNSGLKTTSAPPPTRHLNWHVLPQGKIPWAQLREALAPIIERARGGNRPFIEHRFKVLHGYQPDFSAVGHAGFAGYVIFGFDRLNLYICESALYGNATYVFEENWEQLSQISKAEILNGHLERERIVHRTSWITDIHRLLGVPPTKPALRPAA